jgi:transcription initiation factor IIF auxiliary subunit
VIIVKEFRGLNGTIILNDSEVTIEREKQIDHTFHKVSKVNIAYTEIEEVITVPGSITNGYISIVKKNAKKPAGLINAMKDDCSVIFRLFQNNDAAKIAKEINARREAI